MMTTENARWVVLQREHDSTPDQGTPGVMTCDTGKTFVSLELPDRDNRTNVSRINAGTYVCKYQDSVRFGCKLYHVLDVPGRTDVEIHMGNFAGDVEKGWWSNVEGCILQGGSRGMFNPRPSMKVQKAVLHSIDAVKAFIAEMDGEDFLLIIKDET